MLSLAGFTPSDRVLGIEEITDEGGEPSLTWFAFRCSMKPCRGSQIGSIAARPVSPGLGLAGGHQTIPLLLPSFKSTTLSSPSGPRASSQTDDLLCPLEISQNPPYHVPADAWASSLQIGKGEVAGECGDGRFNQRGLGAARALHLASPLLELAVSVLENEQNVTRTSSSLRSRRCDLPKTIVPIRFWSTTTPSIRLEEMALSIKACSRKTFSTWGDCRVKSSCLPRASPRSARYHVVVAGNVSIPDANCRRVITTHCLRLGRSGCRSHPGGAEHQPARCRAPPVLPRASQTARDPYAPSALVGSWHPLPQGAQGERGLKNERNSKVGSRFGPTYRSAPPLLAM